jgi:hypothetical protein
MQKSGIPQSPNLGKSRLECLADIIGEFLATAWLQQCRKDHRARPTSSKDVIKTRHVRKGTKSP